MRIFGQEPVVAHLRQRIDGIEVGENAESAAVDRDGVGERGACARHARLDGRPKNAGARDRQNAGAQRRARAVGTAAIHDEHAAEQGRAARVGVVGIGALGHLAIQFASKMGCDVVAFSGTESKKEEALVLGAKSFVVTKGLDELKLNGKLINHLLVTTSAFPDWKQ